MQNVELKRPLNIIIAEYGQELVQIPLIVESFMEKNYQLFMWNQSH